MKERDKNELEGTEGEEIRPLNLSDLDVEELEQRLELATAVVSEAESCYSFFCTSYTPPPPA